MFVGRRLPKRKDHSCSSMDSSSWNVRGRTRFLWKTGLCVHFELHELQVNCSLQLRTLHWMFKTWMSQTKEQRKLRGELCFHSPWDVQILWKTNLFAFTCLFVFYHFTNLIQPCSWEAGGWDSNTAQTSTWNPWVGATGLCSHIWLKPIVCVCMDVWMGVFLTRLVIGATANRDRMPCTVRPTGSGNIWRCYLYCYVAFKGALLREKLALL